MNQDQTRFPLGLGLDSVPKPSHDCLYFAGKISARWHSTLTPAAIQKLIAEYGGPPVEAALRELHGFPPEEAIRSPYAYLESMLKADG